MTPRIRTISSRYRIWALIFIMISVALGTGAIALVTLYQTAFEQQCERLVETVSSQAQLIEAVARFAARHSSADAPGGAFAATLSQIRDAHQRYDGLGKSGEFTLAKRQGEQIVFLLRHRNLDHELPGSLPISGAAAEPMRRALAGETGTLIGRDYRMETVLAAYQPVTELNLGIVAKIDLAEIRAPFIKAGLLIGGVTLILICFGSALHRHIGNPLIRNLEENERKYRTLFESGIDGVLLMSDVFEECNDQACRLLARERKDLIGHSPAEFSPPFQPDGKDSAVAAEELLGAVFSGIPQSFYWQHQHPDGTLIDLNISLQAVEVSGRQMCLATLHDITESRRAEQALRVSEGKYKQPSQEFQALLDGIPDSLLLLSPELEVVWANQGAADSCQRVAVSLPGEHCYKLWHNRSAPCEQCLVRKSFRSGRTEIGKMAHPDGRTWGIKAFPLKDSAGQVINVIKLASDITEQHRLREEASHNSRLASLGELAAGVAHEINNPNGLILLNLPALREVFADLTPLLDELHREQGDFTIGGLRYSEMRQEIPAMLEELQESADRIKRIVEELKDFAGRDNSTEGEIIDLNHLVQTATRLVTHVIKRSTDSFSTNYENALPKITGNFQRLEQVVVNLIMNACQALPNRDRGIFITTRFDDAAGSCVLEVRDEGIGIAEEHLPQIINPFFTTKRISGGTGLGLSISSRIVREHGGRLDFSSVPNAGTSVTLELPVNLEVQQS